MSAISNYDKGHMFMPGNSAQKNHRPILPAPLPSSFTVKSPKFHSLKLPFRPAGNEPKRRQKKRSGSKKIRDLVFWRRVYESEHLSDDEKLLVHLKIIKGLSWKETQRRFNEGKPLQMQQAALQMRLNRLAEKMDSLWAQAQEPNPPTAGPSTFPALSSTLIQPTSWPMELVYPRDNLGYYEITPNTSIPLFLETSWPGIGINYAYSASNTSPSIGISNTLGYSYFPDQLFG
ncbi:hypothetical protein GcM3_106024 [Golovinomyces cichoracearum]|uniref:Uncharacterized protein n=1 Tax=Golovinomyces cichoracearum TaxID=62708 RepID=A0A420I9N1_9PEZI|nr:hypothetical protein GcM3_106024 [Golovinomyces cichoracearum]